MSKPANLYDLTTERELQDMAIQVAKLCGYDLVYHTYNSQRSAPGYPDLVIMRLPAPGKPADMLVREIKRQGGRITLAQRRWIEGYQANGIDAGFLFPSNFDEFIARLQRGRTEVPELSGR